jgi:transposase-like protein
LSQGLLRVKGCDSAMSAAWPLFVRLIVQATYTPGASVSMVARRHGVAPNQVFSWRRLYSEGALSAVGAGEAVVLASEYRALARRAGK